MCKRENVRLPNPAESKCRVTVAEMLRIAIMMNNKKNFWTDFKVSTQKEEIFCSVADLGILNISPAKESVQ